MMRIAMIAAAALLSFGHAAQAQAPTEDKQQTQAALDAYNSAYADLLGVGVPEAIAYQAKVGEAQALDARLNSRPDYVGFFASRRGPPSTLLSSSLATQVARLVASHQTRRS